MKVVLVGGSGLIGRRIAALLAGRGDRVTVLSRDPARAGERLPVGVSVESWSPHDPAELADRLRGAGAVVNLAGVPIGPRPWTPGRRRAILESRITATRAIVSALGSLEADERPAVLLSASGTDTYTGQDAVPATESSPPSSGFLADVCLAWEAEAERASALGIRVAIIRIGFVLAPGAKALGLYTIPFRLHLGGPIGSGRQWMSWVHLDDVARLAVLALDDDRVAGPINAVGPNPARQADVAKAIGAALGRRSWLRVPAWAVRLALQGQATLPLDSRRVLPARALALGFRFTWTDLRAAMRDVLRGAA